MQQVTLHCLLQFMVAGESVAGKAFLKHELNNSLMEQDEGSMVNVLGPQNTGAGVFEQCG